MLSASGVPRALKCVSSLVLKRHHYESEYAAAGNEYHEGLEAAIDVGDESAIPDEILALVREGDEMITEKAFAYDVATDTARVLKVKSKRAYEDLKPFEIPGSPDLIIRGNGRVIVVDHKSFEEVDSADRNAQAATYALMVARAWGYDEVEVAIVYKATFRRPSHAALGPLDLAAHADRLRQLQLDAAQARVNPLAWLKSGDHCKYCESWLSCPKWDSLREQVSSGELALTAEAAIPFANDDDAARGHDLLGQLQMMTTRLRAALYARAKERPVPLPDGMVLAEVAVQGKRQIDADKAYALVREKYGQAVADKAVQRKVAQKWIETALKDAGIPSPAKAKDAIVKQLEQSGAVERRDSTRIEVVPAARLLKESATAGFH